MCIYIYIYICIIYIYIYIYPVRSSPPYADLRGRRVLYLFRFLCLSTPSPPTKSFPTKSS